MKHLGMATHDRLTRHLRFYAVTEHAGFRSALADCNLLASEAIAVTKAVEAAGKIMTAAPDEVESRGARG